MSSNSQNFSRSYAVYTVSSHFWPNMNDPVPALVIHVYAFAPSSVRLSEGYRAFGMRYCCGVISKSAFSMLYLMLGRVDVMFCGNASTIDKRPLNPLGDSRPAPGYCATMSKRGSLRKDQGVWFK